MNSDEIQTRIPHRPPMLLVDEVVSQDETSIVCRKTFRDEEYFFQGHFPDMPIVPGVIQCECCLQAGAVLLGSQSPTDEGGIPVATRMDSVKFKQIVRPGDTVEIHVRLKERISNAYFMSGKMLLEGKVTARLDFACSLAKAEAVTLHGATAKSVPPPKMKAPSRPGSGAKA